MQIGNETINEFLDELASKNPTPGGGAVAALTAAMAAALVEMVCNLTKDKRIKGIRDESKKLRKRLLELADEDASAFDAVMAAYKSKSKFKIKEALKKAIEVPQKTKELTYLVQRLAKVMVKKGNKNAVSDAKTALHLAEAAQKSAQENIDINKMALVRLG